MTELYSEWRNFYAEKVRSWMSLEELRAECGKLQTADAIVRAAAEIGRSAA